MKFPDFVIKGIFLQNLTLEEPICLFDVAGTVRLIISLQVTITVGGKKTVPIM